MPNRNSLSKICHKIAEECTECYQCVEECFFLQETGLTPAEIAARGPSVEEAYSCTLCGLCETLCPASLSLSGMFSAARKEAVDQGRMEIAAYRYMFPDRKNQMMTFYRKHQGLNYNDLSPDRECSTAFFPGCIMLTYSPELVRAVFAHLQDSRQELTLITDCCGLPLEQLGVQARHHRYLGNLQAKLAGLKIKSLITACPNCYYQLSSLLSPGGIKLLTVYEALNIDPIIGNYPDTAGKSNLITIHDSCPDRRDGIFAGQVREALKRKGYTIVELPNSKEKTTCCGSGGQITHFRPDLAEKLVDKRWQEFHRTGAQFFTAYCLGCVLNLAKNSGNKKVQHVLNLLLDVPQDFTGVKQKLRQLFEGPQGEKNWEAIMNEEETDNEL
jgi:fumarate reductase (CoM/CoB) subunit B